MENRTKCYKKKWSTEQKKGEDDVARANYKNNRKGEKGWGKRGRSSRRVWEKANPKNTD